MLLSLSLFLSSISLFHVHVALIIILLTITEFWRVKFSSDTAAFNFIALGWNRFAACCLQNLVRCNLYSSWKHGRPHWFSPSFLPQSYSHGFSWGALPVTQFSHMTETQCDHLMFNQELLHLVEDFWVLVAFQIFLHHQFCFSILRIYF